MADKKTSSNDEMRWRASPSGIVANDGVMLLKLAFTRAREAGADTEEGTSIDRLWNEAQTAYATARALFMESDEVGSARHAAIVGLAAVSIANDREWVIKQIQSDRGKKSRGVPRPNAVPPLTRALRELVQEGLTNDRVIELLCDADQADRTVGKIVCFLEFESGESLSYYLPGQDPSDAVSVTFTDIRKKLSAIRQKDDSI